MKAVFLCIVVQFAMGVTMAKPAGDVNSPYGHSRDMADVLGIDTSSPTPQTAKLQKLVSVFAKEIDDMEGSRKLLQAMKTLAPSFTWTDFTHRLFFHWGFHTNPRNSRALKQQISEAAQKDSISEEDLWRPIIQEQGGRNTRMMDAVREFGIQRREHIQAVAAILYDVHILGDYIDGAEMPREALHDLAGVLRELQDAIKELSANNDASAKALMKSLLTAFGSKTGDQGSAEAMLNLLKQELPLFLKQNKILKFD